ncbi:MAG TPA: peptidoglycan-binding domain-containing protein [Polyangia bacterium]|jgi:peptidoglycan hydrolase-like protein with peptidoglycan-binding domain
MKGRWTMVVLATALLAACAHTKTTDQGAASTQQDGGGQEATEAKAAKATKPAPAGAGSRAGEERAGVPLATAPEGLLAPGAEKKIRERLAADGFLARDADSDAATREGLRRFQRAKDLPATGVADQETVRRLGLDPDEIFRKASVKD